MKSQNRDSFWSTLTTNSLHFHSLVSTFLFHRLWRASYHDCTVQSVPELDSMHSAISNRPGRTHPLLPSWSLRDTEGRGCYSALLAQSSAVADQEVAFAWEGSFFLFQIILMQKSAINYNMWGAGIKRVKKKVNFPKLWRT